MAHEADALERRDPARAPVVEELHEGWEQSILGRVPRLEEVLVEADLVDRPDGDVGVGVGREEHALRARQEGQRRTEQLDAGHRGHPLVGDEQGDRRAAQDQAADGIEGVGARARGHDPVVAPEPAPQLALHGAQDLGVVVDDQDDRVRHRRACLRRVGRARTGRARARSRGIARAC